MQLQLLGQVTADFNQRSFQLQIMGRTHKNKKQSGMGIDAHCSLCSVMLLFWEKDFNHHCCCVVTFYKEQRCLGGDTEHFRHCLGRQECVGSFFSVCHP
jgi:hypothetical protein